MTAEELIAAARAAGATFDTQDGPLVIHGWDQLHPALQADLRRHEHEVEMALVSERIESHPVGWRRHGPTTWLAEVGVEGLIVDYEPVRSGRLALEWPNHADWFVVLRRVDKLPATLCQSEDLERVLGVIDRAAGYQ